MKKIVVVLILVSFLLPTASLMAQEPKYLVRPGILPDSKIYWLDVLGEEVRYFLTFGKIQKADYKMKVAEERLSELKALYEEGVEEYTDLLLTNYEKDILEAQNLYAEVKFSSIEKVEELQNYTEDQILLNEGDVKSYLIDTVPEKYTGSVNNTVGAVGFGFNKLLQHLEQKNKDIEVKRGSLGVE